MPNFNMPYYSTTLYEVEHDQKIREQIKKTKKSLKKAKKGKKKLKKRKKSRSSCD